MKAKKVTVKVKKAHPGVPTPAYQTAGAAGCDVCSQEDAILRNGEVKVLSTGLFLEVPEGYECQIRPRSGLAARGITILNAPGTLDSDYRGELKVILHSIANQPVKITTGDRIAQLVFAPVTRVDFEVVEELGKTERGEGGFGSTGVK